MLAGSVISVITGVLTTKWFDWRQSQNNYIQIKKYFSFNLDLMGRMVSQLNAGTLPDYKLDLTVLDFLISHGPKSFKNNIVQFNDFNDKRYQMHHINNQLLFLFALPEPKDKYFTDVVKHIQGEIIALTNLLANA